MKGSLFIKVFSRRALIYMVTNQGIKRKEICKHKSRSLDVAMVAHKNVQNSPNLSMTYSYYDVLTKKNIFFSKILNLKVF